MAPPDETSQPAKRPASLLELAERVELDQWIETQASLTFRKCLKSANALYITGKELVKGGNLEDGFVQLARAATLVLDILPSYPDYSVILNDIRLRNLTLNGQRILDDLSEIKPHLVQRHEAWMKRDAESIEHLPLLNHVSHERLLIDDGQPDTKEIEVMADLGERDSVLDQLRSLLLDSEAPRPTGEYGTEQNGKSRMKTKEGEPERKVEAVSKSLFSTESSNQTQSRRNLTHQITPSPVPNTIVHEHDNQQPHSTQKNKRGIKSEPLFRSRPSLPPPSIPVYLQKKEDSGDSDVTNYSEASSYTDSTDYGLFYRRMALSDESDAHL